MIELCLENNRVKINIRTRAGVGEHGCMGTVRETRATTEELLKCRLFGSRISV